MGSPGGPQIQWAELPGPETRWWGLPTLAAMRRDLLAVMQAQRAHGGMVRMQILNERVVDVFEPELARALLVDHADALVRWERAREVFAEVMGQSVLVTEGAAWQRQRRMLMQAFTPKRVVGYAQLMTDAAADGLNALEAGEHSADRLFSHLTMDVILRTLFSTPAGQNTDAATQATQHLGATGLQEMFWPMTLPDWLPLPGKAAKRQALRCMRELIQSHITSRSHETPVHNDLLGWLQTLRDEETGQGLSTQEVFDQCMVSFLAGHETSATALIWWSALMAQHPQAQARATAEVQAVLGDHAQTPTASDLNATPWLAATLKEAMRLYPPIAIVMTRRLTREVVVQGVRLPARTLVRVSPWVMHRDPQSWPDEPDAFKPERFMGDAAQAIPRGAYLPFGIGPRVCLAQHFATMEMGLIAAMLLQRFELQPCGPLPAPRPAVTLRPEGGLRVNLRTRLRTSACWATPGSLR